MGNALRPCLNCHSSKAFVKLVFWGGSTRLLADQMLAGELMFEFPDRIVCHADSFFIGHPLPTLAIDDELLAGETYFVLPADLFPSPTLTAAALASLSPGAKGSPINFGRCALERVRDGEGRPVIKVLPEFIERVIGGGHGQICGGDAGGALCSTPELRKHYEQLVGPRDRPWSPKLETISESKARTTRTSPAKLLLGLEWR